MIVKSTSVNFQSSWVGLENRCCTRYWHYFFQHSTPYSYPQVTNYGLGGLCETHIDPHGYIEGKKTEWHQKHLIASGDMIATVMGWLDDVRGGGCTAFDFPGYEQVIRPTRGAIAFWFNLDGKQHREARSSHGGCPVLMGSKWILNKWIMSFDQFANVPCRLDPKAPMDGARFLKV